MNSFSLQPDNENSHSLQHNIKKLQDQLKTCSEQLALSQQKLRLCMAANNLAWWELDFCSGKVSVDEQMTTVLGYDLEELSNCNYTDLAHLIHPDDLVRITTTIKEYIAGKIDSYEIEYRIRTKNGDYKWYSDRATITERDQQGNALRINGVVFDNTRHHEVEDALRIANETKDKLFSIIAHDIRSSLSHLEMMLNTLTEPSLSLSKDLNDLLVDRIKFSSAATMELLENLLQWAKTQQNCISIKPVLQSVNDLIMKTISRLTIQASIKDIRFSIQINDKLKAFFDFDMLSLVFRNLISNAIKYSYRGGIVSITALEQDSTVVITIADQGIGMDDQTRNDLFILKANKSKPGTDSEKGTGIGLLLCKEFVERNKGAIWVESTLNQGSQFFIRIPMYPS